MPKRKDLKPELKAMLDVIEESGEEGTSQGEIFDIFGKDNTRDTLVTVMTQLGELREMGLIHRKFVEEERTERGVTMSIRWFAAGKGESVREGTFSFIPG